MANFMTDSGVPHSAMKNLVDPFMAAILGRPVLSLINFDNFLHKKYGEYENQGKSMKDIFSEFFGDKAEQAKYYFGLEKWTLIDNDFKAG